jgi:hypothetical protein
MDKGVLILRASRFVADVSNFFADASKCRRCAAFCSFSIMQDRYSLLERAKRRCIVVSIVYAILNQGRRPVFEGNRTFANGLSISRFDWGNIQFATKSIWRP